MIILPSAKEPVEVAEPLILLIDILAKWAVSSWKVTSPPSTLITKSAAASIFKLLAEIVKSVPSPSIFSLAPPNWIPLSLGNTTSAVGLKLIILPEIVKSVPSPSIFSPSLPKVTPTPDGILTSPTAVRLISAPALIVKSVSLLSIFSLPLASNTNPTFCGMWTSLVAVRFNLALEAIVKSVPSPSIFSPSSPKVNPMSVGMFISPLAPTDIFKSVSSLSIFSCVPNIIPTFAGIFTSAVPVRLMLLPLIVKSVPSPSIFSPSLPKVRPTLAGMFISALE